MMFVEVKGQKEVKEGKCKNANSLLLVLSFIYRGLITLLLGLFATTVFANEAGKADKVEGGNNIEKLQILILKPSSEKGWSLINGTVESVQDNKMSAQVFGRVNDILVKAGDSVRAGQLLIKIDGSGARQLTISAKALVNVARQELSRQRTLFAKKYISKAALDSAISQYKVANSGLAIANSNLAFYTLKAPFSGKVSNVSVVKGDMASPGMVLMKIYNPSAIRVSVPVSQDDLQHINANTPVKVEWQNSQGVTQELATNSLQVLPAIDPTSHTALVRIGLENNVNTPAPGTFVNVRLGIELKNQDNRKNDNLWITSKALVVRGEMKAVYILHKNGRAILRQVRLGKVRGDLIEVVSGIKSGEMLILNPQVASR